MSLRLRFVLVLLILSSSRVLCAQDCAGATTLNDFIVCRLQAQVIQRLGDLDPSKQSEAPSITNNATVLADKSSAPDVVAASVNPSALSSKSRVPDTTDLSLTVSLYGIYSLWRQTDPFNPAFYKSSMPWRRLSLSLAPSFPETSTATSGQGSRSYGAKYLVSNSRNIFDPSNTKRLQALKDNVSAASQFYAQDLLAVQQYLSGRYRDALYNDFATKPGFSDLYSEGNTFDSFVRATASSQLFPFLLLRLTKQDLAEIDSRLRDSLASTTSLDAQLKSIAQHVKTSPQVALSFLSKISKGTGNNLYRSEVVIDAGVKKVTTTTNISFDFSNSQTTSKPNRDIFRFVQDVEVPLIPQKSPLALNPLTLGLSGEGDWGSNGTPIYKAQGKLKITFIDGLDIPIVVTYANQTSVMRPDLKGQMGLAFDFAKISRAFRTKPAVFP
jgi:hypothetical protein